MSQADTGKILGDSSHCFLNIDESWRNQSGANEPSRCAAFQWNVQAPLEQSSTRTVTSPAGNCREICGRGWAGRSTTCGPGQRRQPADPPAGLGDRIAEDRPRLSPRRLRRDRRRRGRDRPICRGAQAATRRTCRLAARWPPRTSAGTHHRTRSARTMTAGHLTGDHVVPPAGRPTRGGAPTLEPGSPRTPRPAEVESLPVVEHLRSGLVRTTTVVRRCDRGADQKRRRHPSE
jgi:hypothetical protein